MRLHIGLKRNGLARICSRDIHQGKVRPPSIPTVGRCTFTHLPAPVLPCRHSSFGPVLIPTRSALPTVNSPVRPSGLSSSSSRKTGGREYGSRHSHYACRNTEPPARLGVYVSPPSVWPRHMFHRGSDVDVVEDRAPSALPAPIRQGIGWFPIGRRCLCRRRAAGTRRGSLALDRSRGHSGHALLCASSRLVDGARQWQKSCRSVGGRRRRPAPKAGATIAHRFSAHGR